MRDLSLHLMDIIQNSVAARSKLIKTLIKADKSGDLLVIEICDDGVGMDKDFLSKVVDPFTTTRTTRRIGLGIPMFKASSQAADGDFEICSEPGKGTEIKASFIISNIDRLPLGDIGETFSALAGSNSHIDFELCLVCGQEEFNFRTTEIKEQLGEVPLSEFTVMSWIKDYINEGVKTIFGGVLNEVDS